MITDLSLQYLLEVPAGDDGSLRPMVVVIHGRGADAHDLADLAPVLDPGTGCRFVFPNAPTPFEAYPGMTFGWTWFDGWPPVHESVITSRERLLCFLEEVTARYPTPAGGLILAGFSQGALMALDAGLRTPSPPAGIVVMSGGLYDADLPDLTNRSATPVLIAHGSLDAVVSVNYARRARRVLEDAGFPVEYHEYPMDHQVIQEEADAVREFVGRCLTRR